MIVFRDLRNKSASSMGTAAVFMAALLALPPAAHSAADDPEADLFTFAAGGDLIGPHHAFPSAGDQTFLPVAALFKHADLGFANAEFSIFDLESFAGYPAAENGGGPGLVPASVATDLRAMGITLVSKANNHATDWGGEGLVATLNTLAAAGVAQAGAGLSLDQARAPVYVETPAGMAALVDTASTFPPMAVAGPAVERDGKMSHPRPGISVLHIRQVRLVTAKQMAALRTIVGVEPSAANEIRVSDQVFRVASQAGSIWEMEKADESAILASVAEARQKARFVVFSIHAHETAGNDDVPPAVDYQPMVLHKANEAPSPNEPRPAAFEPELFHAAIDAGADVVVRTGPHTLNGIEIYKGKPIFYSLGSLFFDFGGRRAFTSAAGETFTLPDEWFETIVPVTTFKGSTLKEIRLYPMAIEPGGAMSGVPHPASPDQARQILERVKAESAAFGTDVQIENNVGIIRGSAR